MATLIKLGIGVGLITFGASYFDIVRDLFTTVRVSVTGLELTRMDEALQRQAALALDAQADPLPKSQEEFENFLRDSFEDRGRDVTLDQFGNRVLYRHGGSSSYFLASAGPDGRYATDDDVLLARSGKKRRVSHSPEDIEKLMHQEINKALSRQASGPLMPDGASGLDDDPGDLTRSFGSGGDTGGQMPREPRQPSVSKPKSERSKAIEGLGAGRK
ncbi:MAG: hypothetical protein HYU36_23475 [Planctomycetes bacterium]|nr:hypothetical protein [Planctomycetota bacterium]